MASKAPVQSAINQDAIGYHMRLNFYDLILYSRAEGFTIGFETLHQKSGSESSLPSFKNKILELARANNLPGINLEVIGAETPRPKLKMVMRKYLDGQPANEAEA